MPLLFKGGHDKNYHTNTYADKNSILKICKDIRQSRLCSARLEASSGPRTKGVPTIRGDEDRGLQRRFGQVPSYSPQKVEGQGHN